MFAAISSTSSMSFGSIIFVQFISVISPTSLSLMLSPRGSPVLSSVPWVPGSRGSNEVPVPAVRYSKTFIDASVEEVDSPLGDCSRRSCSAPPGRAEEPFLVSEEEYLNNLTVRCWRTLWTSWKYGWSKTKTYGKGDEQRPFEICMNIYLT